MTGARATLAQLLQRAVVDPAKRLLALAAYTGLLRAVVGLPPLQTADEILATARCGLGASCAQRVGEHIC